jgi:hypothetical protein
VVASGAPALPPGRALAGLKPAQYLALVLLNVLVVGGLLFYLDRREERRDERLLPIIAGCLNMAGQANTR